MNHRQLKFENANRIDELKPAETLTRIGLKEGDVLCDIGAGSGVFTIPAAQFKSKMVYAMDINDDMLSIIEQKIQEGKYKNITTSKVENDHFALADQLADLAILVTVFHELENKPAIVSEISRVLKPQGKAGIVEFHETTTSMGPPASHRVKKEEVRNAFLEKQFSLVDDFVLGENYYCLVFQKQ